MTNEEYRAYSDFVSSLLQPPRADPNVPEGWGSHRILHAALGLCGEAGEVAEAIKKPIFMGHPISQEKLVKEIGDVLFYLVCLCSEIGTPLPVVMKTNMEKLRLRFPNGFTSADSVARKDKIE